MGEYSRFGPNSEHGALPTSASYFLKSQTCTAQWQLTANPTQRTHPAFILHAHTNKWLPKTKSWWGVLQTPFNTHGRSACDVMDCCRPVKSACLVLMLQTPVTLMTCPIPSTPCRSVKILLWNGNKYSAYLNKNLQNATVFLYTDTIFKFVYFLFL